MDPLPIVNDDNYADVLAAPAAVVIFCIVPCDNCAAFEPVVQRAAEALDGRVRIGKAKLHVPGATRGIKRQYRFESFPTTHFYKAGQLVGVDSAAEGTVATQLVAPLSFILSPQWGERVSEIIPFPWGQVS